MIREITETDYPRLAEIWKSAVAHTHDFLSKEDFAYYEKCLPTYFPNVLLFGHEQAGALTGFVGVKDNHIEMLFVHNDYRGNGAGKELILYALRHLHATSTDVNEQNVQAIGFYQHMGFSIIGRSELDGDGKPYPILHLQLQQAPNQDISDQF